MVFANSVVAVSKERSYRWRWWQILNQDHIKSCLMWSKEKRRSKEWSEQKLLKVLAWLQWRDVARKKQKGKEEGEINEDGGE